MTKNKILCFALSREELYVILIYLKANTLTGLGNDNPGMDNTKGGLEIAEKGLLARDFLRPEANGKLKLIDPLFAIIGTCAFPETSILITRNLPGGYKQELYFHTYRKMLVLHTVPITDIHRFEAVEDKKMVTIAINSFLNYNKNDLPKYSPGVLKLDTLLAISKVALEKEGGNAPQLLVEAGLNMDTAQAFAQTLSKPSINTNLAYVARSGEITGGFTILEGHNDLWLLQPDENIDKQINLLSISPDEIYSEVKRFIDL